MIIIIIIIIIIEKKIAVNSLSGEKNRRKMLVGKKKVGEKFSHLQIISSLFPVFFSSIRYYMTLGFLSI